MEAAEALSTERLANGRQGKEDEGDKQAWQDINHNSVTISSCKTDKHHDGWREDESTVAVFGDAVPNRLASLNGGIGPTIGFVKLAVWLDWGLTKDDKCVCARPWTPSPAGHTNDHLSIFRNNFFNHYKYYDFQLKTILISYKNKLLNGLNNRHSDGHVGKEGRLEGRGWVIGGGLIQEWRFVSCLPSKHDSRSLH